jgi:hypothetical protein
MVVPVWFKLCLIIGSAAVTLYLFSRHALVRLFEGGVEQVACELEKRLPDLKGRLIAAVEFSQRPPGATYSTELVAINERQALEKAGLINFNEVLSYHPLLRSGRLVGLAVVVALLMVVVFPGFFSYTYEVYSRPTTEVAPPVAYTLAVSPGSTEWVKYRDISISGLLAGHRLPEQAVVHYRLAGGNWQSEELDLSKAARVTGLEGDSVSFDMTLRQISKSFDYFVEAGRLTSETYTVDVVDRPRVTDIELAIFYPSYTGLQPTTINENNGSFSAVVGSRVTLELETNLPVATAELAFGDSSRTPLQVEGKTASTTLNVTESGSYHVRLTDHLGERNPDPIEYYISAIPDEYPTVDVIRPGFDVNLSDNMMLPLTVRIYDDYGFSSLVLKYTTVSQGRTSDEAVAVLHFSDRIRTEGEVSFNWDLDRLSLYPGDYVSYYFEVADNDAVSGPKLGRSRIYIARLPSLDEIVAETEGDTEARITDTEELLRQGKELAERMKNSARRLQAETQKQNKEGDWQKQKELEQILEKHEQMMEQVDKLAENMEQSMEKLRENALMSREIMEKLEQIQKLFEEVATPEMREAQKRLMEALKNMDRDEILEAMKDFELSQEELLKRLERQVALLKRLQVAQKMEAMLRKAEKILEKQDAINEEAEAAEGEELSELSPPESELKEELESLKSETDELREMLADEEVPPVPQAEQFAETLEGTDADQDMEDMSDALQKQEKSDAVKQGKKAATKLAEIINQMQQQLASMQGQDAEQAERAFRRAIEDATYLSREQEELLSELENMSARSEIAREMAGEQQDLLSSCRGLKNTVAELGKMSPFVAAELHALIDLAASEMSSSIENLNTRRTGRAALEQRDAMAHLNKSAVRLMESLEEQQQCQSAAQCSNPMQQMESLSQQQNKLNERTQNQCQNPGQSGQGKKETEQLRDGLKRLAGEQGSIRKSMEELSKELAGDRQILGRLDDLAREMKEVEEALSQGEAGEETLERQLRIYSRMLEATRSLQRRDFNEQRKATTAEQDFVRVPPALPAELLNDRSNFEERLHRYLGDDYPPQYEEQIKAYFRALIEAQGSAGSGQ